MRQFKYFIYVLLLSIFFLYGLGVGLYRLPPFEQLMFIKKSLSFENKSLQNKVNIDLSIQERSSSDLISLRQDLINFLVPSEPSSVSLRKKNNDVVNISARYYGISVNAVLTKTKKINSDCLKIYIQGHGGNPFDFAYHNELVDSFLEIGCNVLSMSMLGIGLNKGKASFLSRFGEIKLSANQAANHGNYSLFFDAASPHIDPLSLFLYPHITIINTVLDESKYDDVSIMGISGGGWYTVWLAALMPKISTSISYAGSLPLPYSKYEENHGDWEQIHSKLYGKVSYLDLYQLMLVDQFGVNNRSAFLVYNDNDSCCFMDPYVSHFQNTINSSNAFPSIIIDESTLHSINPTLVLDILNSN